MQASAPRGFREHVVGRALSLPPADRGPNGGAHITHQQMPMRAGPARVNIRLPSGKAAPTIVARRRQVGVSGGGCGVGLGPWPAGQVAVMSRTRDCEAAAQRYRQLLSRNRIQVRHCHHAPRPYRKHQPSLFEWRQMWSEYSSMIHCNATADVSRHVSHERVKENTSYERMGENHSRERSRVGSNRDIVRVNASREGIWRNSSRERTAECNSRERLRKNASIEEVWEATYERALQQNQSLEGVRDNETLAENVREKVRESTSRERLRESESRRKELQTMQNNTDDDIQELDDIIQQSQLVSMEPGPACNTPEDDARQRTLLPNLNPTQTFSKGTYKAVLVASESPRPDCGVQLREDMVLESRPRIKKPKHRKVKLGVDYSDPNLFPKPRRAAYKYQQLSRPCYLSTRPGVYPVHSYMQQQSFLDCYPRPTLDEPVYERYMEEDNATVVTVTSGPRPTARWLSDGEPAPDDGNCSMVEGHFGHVGSVATAESSISPPASNRDAPSVKLSDTNVKLSDSNVKLSDTNERQSDTNERQSDGSENKADTNLQQEVSGKKNENDENVCQTDGTNETATAIDISATTSERSINTNGGNADKSLNDITHIETARTVSDAVNDNITDRSVTSNTVASESDATPPNHTIDVEINIDNHNMNTTRSQTSNISESNIGSSVLYGDRTQISICEGYHISTDRSLMSKLENYIDSDRTIISTIDSNHHYHEFARTRKSTNNNTCQPRGRSKPCADNSSFGMLTDRALSIDTKSMNTGRSQASARNSTMTMLGTSSTNDGTTGDMSLTGGLSGGSIAGAKSVTFIDSAAGIVEEPSPRWGGSCHTVASTHDTDRLHVRHDIVNMYPSPRWSSSEKSLYTPREVTVNDLLKHKPHKSLQSDSALNKNVGSSRDMGKSYKDICVVGRKKSKTRKVKMAFAESSQKKTSFTDRPKDKRISFSEYIREKTKDDNDNNNAVKMILPKIHSKQPIKFLQTND